MRHRRWLLALALPGLLLASVPSEARAEAELERLASDFDQLAAGEAPTVAPTELRRAEELLRQARDAVERGDQDRARMYLALLPLQLRLVREIVRARQLEVAAESAEERRLALEREVSVERDALEQVLERLYLLRRERSIPE